jgi:hypothetical protein
MHVVPCRLGLCGARPDFDCRGWCVAPIMACYIVSPPPPPHTHMPARVSMLAGFLLEACA